ncbi:MAG: ribosome-associated translation inhibitor RaiA [Ancalomicrobiaceae bacterium]|nr:ribosome-associated translation inhibitor RaiA [Ancalomicrobiaceae bacterium]
MPLRVSGKNVDIGDALRSYTVGRVGEVLGKFFSDGYKGHVTVEKEGSGFRTECAIHLNTGLSVSTVGAALDPYPSVDQAVERLENRLRRHKGKLRDIPAAQRERAACDAESTYRVIEAPAEDEEVPLDYSPVVIAETTKTVRRMSVGEAVAELDLTGAEFMVFLHGGHGGANVVYRRRDGNIGWIDPALPAGVKGKLA